MNRKDRKVTDFEEVFGILERCDSVRIAMNGDGRPYIVPVSFGCETENGKAVVWFHCAMRGMKMDLLEADPHVCIEADRFLGVEETTHGITTRYESVIGSGTCTFVTDEAEKLRAIRLLLAHYGRTDYPTDRCKGMEMTRVGKIVLDALTGKRNRPEGAKA